MDILGIGIPELIFIALIVLVVLGPKDMQKAGRAMGESLRKLLTSDTWRVITMTNRELQTLPNKLAREANFRPVEQELQIGNALAADAKIETESPILPSPEPPSVKYPASASKTTSSDDGKIKDA